MFLLARAESTEMSFQYLEKIRSKLRSLALTDANGPSAVLAKEVSNKEQQTVNESQDQKTKGIGLKNIRCWSSHKAKPTKLKEKMDKKTEKKISFPVIDAETENEAKTVFTMTSSRSQPSPKMVKKNSVCKKKKLKTKDTKLIKENLPQRWEDSEGNAGVGKIRKKWGWEKREGELMKKKPEKILGTLKGSKEGRSSGACRCEKTKDVTFIVKGLCECDKINMHRIDLGKLYADHKKRKPKTAPHMTDSLILYKERLSRKSERCDKTEDEGKEVPVKKEGKGVSFSKDVVFRRGTRKNEEESFITLYQNSCEKKSACGLTKEQFEKIKIPQKVAHAKEKLS